MLRTEIIQKLINKTNGKKYLEIGFGDGVNFNSIICDYKVSVDPEPRLPATYNLTSDDFFKQNTEKFDVIFIDGLHFDEQVYRDIINSLEILTDNGYIVCHDMSPKEEISQEYPMPSQLKYPNWDGQWTGDCYKAWIKLKTERSDLQMIVVDTDYGCGIISKGIQKLLEISEEVNWQFLNKDRKNLLGLISIDEFKLIYDIRN
jgi:hypothetical protein